MDKLTAVSCSLFMAANIFAIVSLAMPDWIVTDVGGENCSVLVTLSADLSLFNAQEKLAWDLCGRA